MRYIAFDVETPNRYNDRISAIGIAVVEDGEIVHNFYSLVNPETGFDWFNTQLTGIDEAAVAEEKHARGFRRFGGQSGRVGSRQRCG